MNLTFGLGVAAGSGEPVEEIIYSDILRVDITTPEVLASIGGEPMAIDVVDAEVAAEVVGREEAVFDFSGGGIEVAVED